MTTTEAAISRVVGSIIGGQYKVFKRGFNGFLVDCFLDRFSLLPIS
jgi:hypothetical protein